MVKGITNLAETETGSIIFLAMSITFLSFNRTKNRCNTHKKK